MKSDRDYAYRHGLLVRITHWVNLACVIVLLMSGLQIFNAHRALYWGEASDFANPLLAIPAGFPWWLTLPAHQDLAVGRHWHFFFAWLFVANGVLYLAAGVLGGHLWRDLVPTRTQLRHIGRAIIDHLRLRFPRGEAARQYNVLQKSAYLAVVLVLLPLAVLSGMALSPALDAAFAWLPAVFGGRQSARTIHFIAANAIVLFVLIHVVMVLLSGPWNSVRSMITGRYDTGPVREPLEGMEGSRRAQRRRFLRAGVGTAAGLSLGACSRIAENPSVLDVLGIAEPLNLNVHRFLLGHQKLAREFTEADLSGYFKPNGSADPSDPRYRALAARGFADWRLAVDGLVERPLSLSLDELRAMPSRTQITRHDCVEGWSCIGKWKGVPLGVLLARARLHAGARYVVFHCADSLTPSGPNYYESVDIADAFHPQTILAYDMNDRPLPVAHGAPVRMRIERQLGYKMAKYVMRIEVVGSLAGRGGGQGGYWEDRGYAWYAGI